MRIKGENAQTILIIVPVRDNLTLSPPSMKWGHFMGQTETLNKPRVVKRASLSPRLAWRRAQGGDGAGGGGGLRTRGVQGAPSPPHPLSPPAMPQDGGGHRSVPPTSPQPLPLQVGVLTVPQLRSAEGSVSHLLLEPHRLPLLIHLAGSFGEAPLQAPFLVHAPTFPSPLVPFLLLSPLAGWPLGRRIGGAGPGYSPSSSCPLNSQRSRKCTVTFHMHPPTSSGTHFRHYLVTL